MIFRVIICLGLACIVFLPILAVWAWNRRKIAQYEQRALSGREEPEEEFWTGWRESQEEQREEPKEEYRANREEYRTELEEEYDEEEEAYEDEYEYEEYEEPITEPYFMRPSFFCFIIGIIGSIFCYGFTVLMVFLAESERDFRMLTGALLFFVFALWSGYLCFVSLLWAIKVDVEDITVYRFPLRPKVISFHEITKVRYIERAISGNGMAKRQLIAYHGKKKLFEADEDMSHFSLLLKRLEAEKGLEKGFLKEGGLELNAYREEFSISETNADKIRALFGALLGIGLFVGGILCWEEMKEEPNYLLYYIGFFLAFIIGTWNFISVMMRKVTVTYQDIYVRDMKSVMKALFTPGAERGARCYSMRKITRVEDKENFILLYVDGKDGIPEKIAKIWKSDKNFALLAQRLEMEGRWENLGRQCKVRRL